MDRAWLQGVALALSLALPLGAMAADETAEKQESPFAKLAWEKGPAKIALGSRADVSLAEHQAALPEADSNKFLELTGNLPGQGTQIIASKTWWATFDFDDSGYVKDNDKIDADALLKQIKDSDEPANEERKKRGMPLLTTDGWYVPPHYDSQTRQLEWALKLHASDDPKPVINYTVRLLGRSGYERAVLVSSPETMDQDVAEFKQMLTAFDFHAGEKYSEFRQGDRVAEFGLAALVAGGAAAVAVKTGFWKVILAFLAASWKLVAAGVVGLFATIGKLFKRKSSS
ncbi:MAG TPA: DUF2167 domain-containing protein [Burkholderiaceae bacterium]|jgi:uncharacterized membrane-anchored protein